MIKRMLFVVGMALAALTLPSVGNVHAGAYPPGCATVTTANASVNPGTLLQVTASGYTSIGATITFYIIGSSEPPSEGASVIGTAVVQPDGTASITIAAPTTFGSYDIIAVGGDCEDALTSFTVGNIPGTGADSQEWLRTATALVAVGVGFALVAVRRRREPATA